MTTTKTQPKIATNPAVVARNVGKVFNAVAVHLETSEMSDDLRQLAYGALGHLATETHSFLDHLMAALPYEDGTALVELYGEIDDGQEIKL